MQQPFAEPGITLRLHGEPTCNLGGERRVLEPRAAALLALVAVDGEVTRERAAALLWPDSANPRGALRQQLARFRRLAGADLVQGDDRLRLAAGVRTDVTGHGAPGTEGAVATPAPPRPPLLGELRFPDQPAFDAWLMRSRARTPSTSTVSGAATAWTASTESTLSTATIATTGAAISGAATPLPATLLRPPRLIGRAVEHAALVQAWEAGLAVLLLGEAGLGKSRLLAEFAQGRRVLLVSGRPGDAGVPYATMARLLRLLVQRCEITLDDPNRHELARLLPEMAPGADLPAEGQRLALQSAVERLLAGARMAAGDRRDVDGKEASRSGAHLDGLIVDDLHFADDASVEMLQALVGALGATLRFALAQRPGEGSAATLALRDALEEGGLLASHTMAPLTEDELGELVASLQIDTLDASRLGSALARHTGGNPLFALETLKQGLAGGALRAGVLPQPGSVGTLIERRLQRLSAQATALARVAAIAGVDFSIALAEEVMGARAVDLADAWAELEAAQVLREDAFAHDLVRDAVLRSVPAAIARHLHGAIAAHLGRHEGVPARVAAHWLAADAQRQALPWLGRAAQQARTGLRRREELQFLLTQADVEERLGERGAAFETFKLAHAAQLAVDDGAADLRSTFEALKRLALTPQQCIDVDNMRAADLINEGRHGDAEVLARRTLAAAGRCNYEAGCASSMSTLSMALSMQGRLTEALAVVQEFWPVVERLPDPDPDYFNTHAVLLDNLGRPREAIPLHRQVFEITLRRGDSGDAVSSLGNLAVSLMECGLMRGAQRALERAEALRRAHDDGEGLRPVMMLQALAVERALGRYDQALAWADRAHGHLASAVSAYLPLVGLGRAATWTDLGQLARAQQALPEAEALQAVQSWLVARRWQYAARLRSALGGNPLQCAEAAAAALGDENILGARESVTLQLASVRGTASDLDAISAVGAAARANGRDGTALAADLRAAELAAALGMAHAAATHADRGRALLVADRDRDDAVTATDLSDAEAWLMLGRAYAAVGRAVDAADAFARGADWVVRTAREHVAPEFRDSFLHRNPVNRDLLAAARKQPRLSGLPAQPPPASPR